MGPKRQNSGRSNKKKPTAASAASPGFSPIGESDEHYASSPPQQERRQFVAEQASPPVFAASGGSPPDQRQSTAVYDSPGPNGGGQHDGSPNGGGHGTGRGNHTAGGTPPSPRNASSSASSSSSSLNRFLLAALVIALGAFVCGFARANDGHAGRTDDEETCQCRLVPTAAVGRDQMGRHGIRAALALARPSSPRRVQYLVEEKEGGDDNSSPSGSDSNNKGENFDAFMADVRFALPGVAVLEMDATAATSVDAFQQAVYRFTKGKCCAVVAVRNAFDIAETVRPQLKTLFDHGWMAGDQPTVMARHFMFVMGVGPRGTTRMATLQGQFDDRVWHMLQVVKA